MNRGQLEEWAVQLHMIRNRLRIRKADKAEARKIANIRVTKISEKALVEMISVYIDYMEVM